MSATDAESIASTLPFSVSIFPSKADSIALRWVWAEPLNTVSAAMYADDWAETDAARAAAVELLNAVSPDW